MSHIVRMTGFPPGGAPSWALAEPPSWQGFGPHSATGGLPADPTGWSADFSAGLYRRSGLPLTANEACATLRNSVALGVEAGGALRQFAVNEMPVLAGLGLDVWGQCLNKCEIYNAAPADISGLVKSGAATSTLSVVDDSAEILAAGLSGVCSGQVYKLDNSLGATNARANANMSIAGNTNPHNLSVYWRGTGMAGLDFSETTDQVLPATYERYDVNRTPASAANYWRIHAAPGAVVYFILCQFEERSLASPPIVTAGAAAARLATDVTIRDFGVLAAARGLQDGFGGSIRVNLTQLSGPAVRGLAAFGADANNCLKLQIGTDGKVRMILRKAGADVLTLATADGFSAPGPKVIDFNAVPGTEFSLSATGLTPPASVMSSEALPGIDGAAPSVGSLFGALHLNGILEAIGLRSAV
ncbi:hypothetical protein [Parvibaculum sp.]|uniref:hypothetical protein n=1 Tax=Parvibaculum sp. TaxID=2024848 RepID=UPI003BAC8E00